MWLETCMCLKLSDLVDCLQCKTQNNYFTCPIQSRWTTLVPWRRQCTIFTSKQPHLDTVSPLVTKSTRRQCCFVTAETVTLSVPIMLPCLFLLCISLLTTTSLCSVTEQTLYESTVGTLSSTAECATAEGLQPNRVTQQDKHKMALAKTILYPCLLVWEHSEMSWLLSFTNVQ